MKKLRHWNIVKLFEVVDDPVEGNIYLIMEYFSTGSFLSARHQASKAHEFKLEQGRQVLREDSARMYFRQLALGLDYLHSYARTVHRDIKPENCLLEGDRIALVDFGISQKADSVGSDTFGTAYYIAPERYSGEGSDPFANDIWALGVTLFEAVCGHKPFEAPNQVELMARVKYINPLLPKSLSPDLRDLLERMLDKSPDTRPKVKDVLAHEWTSERGQQLFRNEYDDSSLFFVTQKDIFEAIFTLVPGQQDY